jgi:transposase InsO family protein
MAARRFRRLMREHDLSAPNHPPQRPVNDRDGRITTDRVDETWGTDMARVVLASGARVHVFAAVDHCNSECIGMHAAFGANRWETLEPVRQGVGRHFGPAGADIAAGLKLRHDHGADRDGCSRRFASPSHAAFAVIQAGRHPPLPFRGLLRLHACYGPLDRSTA